MSPTERARVLIADDDEDSCRLLAELLGQEHEVLVAHDAATAMATIRSRPCDVLLVAVRMAGGGLRLVEDAAATVPEAGIIVVAGATDLAELIGAQRLAEVFDYVHEPGATSDVRHAIVRCLEMRRLRAENARLKAEAARLAPVTDLVGESAAMRSVKDEIARVAPAEATVLLTGPSGSGKEVAARAIHRHSRRAAGPFVAIHCGALAPDLLESELFGHVRGAFTGADRGRAGRFEEAEGGTLFLDEVGTMSPEVQVRLLRVLGTRDVCRVGEDRARRTDVRIVAATNASLEDMVAAGSFREDLYYRLNVYPIRLPALAERPEDIPLLASHLLDLHCDRAGRPRMSFSPLALARLGEHEWPGNVRELDNAVQRAAILAGSRDVIDVQDVVLFPLAEPKHLVTLPPEGLDLSTFMDGLEMDLLRSALERTQGNRQRAADLLHLHRTTLVQKLRRQEQRDRLPVPGAREADS